MKRLLSLLCLLLLAPAGFGLVVTTTINCASTAGCENLVTQAATNATENKVVITVTPGHPVTVQIKGDAAWYYRTGTGGADGSGTHDATTQDNIAAEQVQKLRFTQSFTFYTVRQTADGTLKITPLLVE